LEAAISDLRVKPRKEFGKGSWPARQKNNTSSCQEMKLYKHTPQNRTTKNGHKWNNITEEINTRSRTSNSHPMLILAQLLHKTEHRKAHISPHLGTYSKTPSHSFPLGCTEESIWLVGQQRLEINSGQKQTSGV